MDLKQGIQNKSREEIETLIKRAQRIKEREIASALEKKETLFKEEQAKIDKEFAEKFKKIKANLELEYKIKYLIYREKLLTDIIQEVEKEFQNFPRDENYFSFLKKIITQAISEIKEDKLVISLNKEDLKRYSQSLEEIFKEKKIDFETVNIAGGVIVKSESAKLIFNASFENLISSNLERIKEELVFNLKDGKN